MGKMSENKRITIVGAGLVGALNACFMARRGFDVGLYEIRSDIRKQEVVQGRSINLALSRRGLEALAAVGLKDTMMQNGIPMYARMIHDLDGRRRPIPYGKPDQFIMSVDRRLLNELMITAAEKYSNVSLHFDHKFTTCNFANGEATFVRPDGSKVPVPADLVVGCDGAFSRVRKEMIKATRMDYSQQYIPHGYLELRIPPTEDNQFLMEKHYLHIWPRNEFMMIALPNVQDNSFVVTLFMPFSIFESIITPEDVINFFETNFPDSIPLIGRNNIEKQFFSLKPLPLVSVKCKPYHVGDKCVIMGDAAHAMVPFYGQGMNCGFEDSLIFDTLLTDHNNNISIVLEEYTAFRNPDAEAICDLAMYNYVEMRAHVNSKMFLVRKKADAWLNWLMPNTWTPLYSMVAFTRTRYHECIEKRHWQDRVLARTTKFAALCLAVFAGVHAVRWVALHRAVIEDVVFNNAFFDKINDMF